MNVPATVYARIANGLEHAFVWNNSREGYDFWRAVFLAASSCLERPDPWPEYQEPQQDHYQDDVAIEHLRDAYAAVGSTLAGSRWSVVYSILREKINAYEAHRGKTQRAPAPTSQIPPQARASARRRLLLTDSKES